MKDVDLLSRYYHEMWNQWNFQLAEELLAPDFVFRGSLGREVRGREAFKDYMQLVRSAFSDFQNTVEQVLHCDTHVVARLTYTGTHDGALLGISPTNRRIVYPGIAIFRTDGHWFLEGYVVGDRLTLFEGVLGQRFWGDISPPSEAPR
jgi:steroid delta-isomerase-like uncharacterized protein